MIITSRKLWYKSAYIILDTDEAKAIASKKNEFDYIEIRSHESLDLPGFSLLEKTTGVIPLTTEEETFAGFNKTTRNEIARTRKDPAFRFECHDGITSAGYGLYIAFQQAARRKPFPRTQLSGCMEFLSYDGDALVSGMFVYPSDPVMRTRSIFSARRAAGDRQAYQRIGYASRRVVFEVCAWGIQHGRTGLDLASLNNTNPETRSISEFKEGFSPKIVPEYLYVYRSERYRRAERILAFLRKLKP